MIELWIPITIAAAFFQNLRSALQKHLSGRLSTLGATYIRFSYACPFAILYCLGLHVFGGYPIPPVNAVFLIYCVLGGLAQILFTFFLLWLFSFRNFAVGTTFSKTEIIQVAVLGLLILGDTLSIGAAVAIAVSMVGLLALSLGQQKLGWRNLLASMTEKPTLIGLASGTFLGASVVFFRGASLSLGGEGFLMQAAFALAVATVLQTVLMGVYVRVREPGQLTAVLVHWRPSMAVGVAGMVASAAWFSAFTIQNAAYVRALGQIELVFTFIVSAFFFKERYNPMEVFGIAAIIVGILILLLAR
ncbi:MAG: EamA family transporter [Rhodospirillales bacterium]